MLHPLAALHHLMAMPSVTVKWTQMSILSFITDVTSLKQLPLVLHPVDWW